MSNVKAGTFLNDEHGRLVGVLEGDKLRPIYLEEMKYFPNEDPKEGEPLGCLKPIIDVHYWNPDTKKYGCLSAVQI